MSKIDMLKLVSKIVIPNDPEPGFVPPNWNDTEIGFVAGQIYFNSADQVLYGFDGNQWFPFGITVDKLNKVLTELAGKGSVGAVLALNQDGKLEFTSPEDYRNISIRIDNNKASVEKLLKQFSGEFYVENFTTNITNNYYGSDGKLESQVVKTTKGGTVGVLPGNFHIGTFDAPRKPAWKTPKVLETYESEPSVIPQKIVADYSSLTEPSETGKTTCGCNNKGNPGVFKGPVFVKKNSGGATDTIGLLRGHSYDIRVSGKILEKCVNAKHNIRARLRICNGTKHYVAEVQIREDLTIVPFDHTITVNPNCNGFVVLELLTSDGYQYLGPAMVSMHVNNPRNSSTGLPARKKQAVVKEHSINHLSGKSECLILPVGKHQINVKAYLTKIPKRTDLKLVVRATDGDKDHINEVLDFTHQKGSIYGDWWKPKLVGEANYTIIVNGPKFGSFEIMFVDSKGKNVRPLGDLDSKITHRYYKQ